MGKPADVSWPTYIKYGLIKRARFFVHAYYLIPSIFASPVYRIIRDFRRAVKDHPQFTRAGFFGRYARYAKFYLFYKTVRDVKPRYVLECGCGVSTLILEQALKDNGFGELVAMEEYEAFGSVIRDMVGERVELVVSPTEETTYDGIQGTRYLNIPERPYDLLFIDGPTTKTVDLDAFYVLEKHPEAKVVVDIRLPTVRALRSKYPGRYNRPTNLGFINFER